MKDNSPASAVFDWFGRLQPTWRVESPGQVPLILVVFSLSGSTAMVFRQVFFTPIGLDIHADFWLKNLAYLVFLFAAYPCLLLLYGAVFGQFRFFLNKERRLELALRRVVTKVHAQ